MKFLDNKNIQKNKLIVLICLCVLLLVALVGSSLAWLSSPAMQGDKLSGGAITNYFHTGTGEKENPFVITRPIHYSNMVNLYQKVEDYSDKHYYFQLGYDFNKDGEFLVYECDDDGKIITEGTGADRREKYSKELNMKCYDGIGSHSTLLPIGTHDKNFLGVFEGKNITIKGFTVTVPQDKNACDIGIFGFIGQGVDVNKDGEIIGEELATVKNVYFSDVTIDIANVTNVISAVNKPQTHGDYAQSHKVNKENEPEQYAAYVGYIAGHIVASSQVENVFINEVTIRGGSPANTNFGYFGCISLDNGVRVPSIGELIASENGPGDEAGFGGSMDMQKLYIRITNVLQNSSYNSISRKNVYPTQEKVTYNQDGKPVVSITATGSLPANGGYSGTSQNYIWSDPSIGTGNYIGANYNTSYNYIYGLNDTQTTKVSVLLQDEMIIEVNWIKSGDMYLSINNSKAVIAQTQLENGVMWFVDSDGHWCTYLEEGEVDGKTNYTIYYLNVDSDKNIVLETTTPLKANVWTVGNDGTFTTSIDNTTYYLVLNNGKWFVTTQRQYQTIGDGNGHFLTLDNNRGIINGAESSSVRWHVQNTGNNYNISVVLNGTRYYLGYNNGLTMTTTTSTWVKDGNGYYIQSGSDRYYLVYDSGWQAQSYSKHKLSSNSHYLSLNNGALLDTTNSASAIEWDIKGSVSGYTISAVQNSVTYYLAYSNPLSVTISTTPFTWLKNGDSYYHNIDGVDYYLQYLNSGWFALPQTYYTISDENLYMTATSPNTFATTTNAGSATRFYSTANTLSGKIMYIVDNQVCYLGANGTSLSNTATNWVNNDVSLNVQDTNNYLNYTQANGWRLEASQQTTVKGYTIYGNSRYINANGTTGLTLGQDGNNATVWVFSDHNSISGTIHYVNNNGTKYYINNSLGLSTNNNTTWTNNSNKLYTGSSYIRIINEWSWSEWQYVYSLTTSNQNNGTTFTFTEKTISSTLIPSLTIASNSPTTPVISDSVRYPVNPPAVSIGQTVNDTVNFSTGEFEQNQLLTGYITLTVRRSTYIPIRVNSDDDSGIASNKAYGVSPKNTGYIVGGTYSEYDQGQGDIRVSRYSRSSSIGGSFSGSTLSKVLTCNDSASPVNITTTLKNNDKNLFDTFQQLLVNSGTYIYGLHFMDSQINDKKIIQAETATIMGKTYLNYDLPESCIDFNVVQRGAIKFFAGDYYRNNNSFFSLHEVFRDAKTQKITAIKEIELVYEHKTEKIKKPYVYKYTDGSYSDSYPGDEEFNENYQVVFKTIWIKEPNGVTTTGNSIYYFEIPCNKGEFALGSVDGRKGAYLIYLDIATNGGAVIDTVVSVDGSGLTEHNFMVDVRPTGGVIDYRSLLQFSVNAPQVANSNDFSITVSFTSDVGDAGKNDYPSGLYTIKIVNKTHTNIVLNVYLCDNDDNANNEYPYAYQIIYTNSSKTDELLKNGDFEFFKRCGKHTIADS